MVIPVSIIQLSLSIPHVVTLELALDFIVACIHMSACQPDPIFVLCTKMGSG